jgi:hypothetical protein
MSGVFQNIAPPTPSPPGECGCGGAGGGQARWVKRGWGVNILEDARHCSVLYICKYFVGEVYSPQCRVLLVLYSCNCPQDQPFWDNERGHWCLLPHWAELPGRAGVSDIHLCLVSSFLLKLISVSLSFCQHWLHFCLFVCLPHCKKRLATVLGIRIHRIHMFLGLLDPDPDSLVISISQKILAKNKFFRLKIMRLWASYRKK